MKFSKSFANTLERERDKALARRNELRAQMVSLKDELADAESELSLIGEMLAKAQVSGKDRDLEKKHGPDTTKKSYNEWMATPVAFSSSSGALSPIINRDPKAVALVKKRNALLLAFNGHPMTSGELAQRANLGDGRAAALVLKGMRTAGLVGVTTSNTWFILGGGEELRRQLAAA